MAAISINAIPASTTAPVTNAANDSGNSDASPFAVILAAAAQFTAPQPGASNDDSDNSGGSDSANSESGAANGQAMLQATSGAQTETADAAGESVAQNISASVVQLQLQIAAAAPDAADNSTAPAETAKAGRLANDNNTDDQAPQSKPVQPNPNKTAMPAVQPAAMRPVADTPDQTDKADKADKADEAAARKPAPKPAKSASDNHDDQLAQPIAAKPDPNIAMIPAVQLAAIPTPPPAANDDPGSANDSAGVNPAQSAKPAPGAESAQASNTAADRATVSAPPVNALSPAASAQAAINGANAGSGTDEDTAQTGNVSGKADKSQASDTKTVSDQNAPPATPPPQAPSNAAPTVATASVAPIHNAVPNQSAAISIQVAPHTAQPDLNAVAAEIAVRSQSGARHFDIRLDPPELGRVEVRLSIDVTGKTEAHLTADHPETLSLLQRDSSILTQALRDAGLDVSQNGLNFSLRDQNSQAGNDRDHGRSASRSNLAASRVLDAAQNASSIHLSSGTGRLDIHV